MLSLFLLGVVKLGKIGRKSFVRHENYETNRKAVYRKTLQMILILWKSMDIIVFPLLIEQKLLFNWNKTLKWGSQQELGKKQPQLKT